MRGRHPHHRRRHDRLRRLSDAEEEPDHKPETLYPKGTYILSVIGRSQDSGSSLPQLRGGRAAEVSSEEGERLCAVCFGAKAKMAEILQGGEDGDGDISSESSSSVMEDSEKEALAGVHGG